jgi:hypothetical protein
MKNTYDLDRIDGHQADEGLDGITGPELHAPPVAGTPENVDDIITADKELLVCFSIVVRYDYGDVAE